MEKQRFRGNIYTELEDAVKFRNAQIDDCLNNRTAIKWITIGSVNALQCACIFFLDGNDTTQTATLSPRSRKLQLEWFDETRLGEEIVLPESHLATPKELLRRVQAEYGSEVIDEYSFRRLISIRNQFTHFYPTDISIELSGYPKILLDAWTAILKICEMSRMYQHRYPKEKFKILVSSIKAILEKIQQLLPNR